MLDLNNCSGGFCSSVTCDALLPELFDVSETWLVRTLRAVYVPVLRFALSNRVIVVVGATCLAHLIHAGLILN